MVALLLATARVDACGLQVAVLEIAESIRSSLAEDALFITTGVAESDRARRQGPIATNFQEL